MGMNFFVKINECKCCDRFDEIHIGKSSAGWSFSFRGHPELGINSWQTWKKFLSDKKIVDDTGVNIEFGTFVDFIETDKSPNFVRTEDADGGWITGKNKQNNDEAKVQGTFNPQVDWDDDEGFAFTVREFC